MTGYLAHFAKRRKTLLMLVSLLAGVALLSFFPAGTGPGNADPRGGGAEVAGPFANSPGGAGVAGAGCEPASGGAAGAGPGEPGFLTAGSPMAGPSMMGLGLKLIGSVVLIVGLLYAVLYAVRRFGPGLRLGGINDSAISVMHKRHIAPKKAIYILKVGSRSMVLGVTDSQISHLADLTEDDVKSLEAEESPRGATFRQYLFGAEPGPKSRS